MNGGRTPSPPTLGSLMNSTSGQQLPPACGARQLSKLKRFLTTLQQFGSDISPEIGERVRTLVLGLVVSMERISSRFTASASFFWSRLYWSFRKSFCFAWRGLSHFSLRFYIKLSIFYNSATIFL